MCKRCGTCCMQLPNWNNLTDVERAMIRMWDKNAEELFKRVKDGRCPNLKIVDGRATCLIYEKRYNFCKAYHCQSEQIGGIVA